MKNTSTLDMVNKAHEETIIVYQEKNGKKALTIKAKFSEPEIAEGIQLCSFKQRRITPINPNEMLELSKTNPKLYLEKLITSQFGDSYLTEQNIGTSYNLPSRFQRFYDECVSFGSDEYQVYFADDSIQYFSDLISKLKLRRIEDSLKYANKKINSGIVRNLKIHLYDGFSFNKTSYCTFSENKEDKIEPTNTLYYTITPDINGKLDVADLENIKKILELFSEKHNGLRHTKWNNTDAVAYGYQSGSVLIEGHDRYPELLDHILTLTKNKRVI